MLPQVINDFSIGTTFYLNKFVEFSSFTKNRIIEIAKKFFKTIAAFAIGFCVGGALGIYYITSQNPIGYTVHYPTLVLFAVGFGLVIGIGAAIDTFRD